MQKTNNQGDYKNRIAGKSLFNNGNPRILIVRMIVLIIQVQGGELAELLACWAKWRCFACCYVLSSNSTEVDFAFHLLGVD